MWLKVELFILLQISLLIKISMSIPLNENGPVKVIVNTTNSYEPHGEKVIKNSIADFSPLPLPQGNFKKNDAKFGTCTDDQSIVHNENIKIENVGPSTVGGVFEFYINSPIRITCIEVQDKMPPGTGAKVLLKEGGPGYNWFFLNVQGKYARGMHIVVTAFGIPDWSKIAFRQQ